MSDNPVIADLKKDRALLVERLEALGGGHHLVGTPESHEAQIYWLRGQIVALNVAISKIEASDLA